MGLIPFSHAKQLAGTLGRAETLPWETIKELDDCRLQTTGMTFDDFSQSRDVYFREPEFRARRRERDPRAPDRRSSSSQVPPRRARSAREQPPEPD